MNAKNFALKSLFLVLVLISTVISLITSLALIAFVLNPGQKETLQLFLGSLILSALFWGSTFYISTLDKEKTKAEKWQEIKDIIIKMPLILASSAITSVYVLIYFFFFAFMTVSSYDKGGLGGDAGFPTLMIVFLFLGVGIFGVVMYNVFKTEKSDITLTLYNQFSVLKWSSLIALPFGLWASYYFYHTEGGAAWVAMFIWGLIFYGIYKVFSKLTDKVQEQITNANVNRIIHEKKKSILNKNQTPQFATQQTTNVSSVADEIKKFKDLLDQGVITQEEFEKQKQKLIL